MLGNDCEDAMLCSLAKRSHHRSCKGIYVMFVVVAGIFYHFVFAFFMECNISINSITPLLLSIVRLGDWK